MASLLERMDIAIPEGGAGPVRNRGGRAGAALPYAGRPQKLGQSKADADMVWKHDLYKGPGKTLGSRLADASTAPGAVSLASQALRQALGSTSSSRGDINFSIKGAAVGSNVVQIENLAKGTTAADVEAIFRRCGPILESSLHNTPKNAEKVTVRLKFKSSEDAKRAQRDFDGKSADGNVLTVSIVGISSTALGGRIAGGLTVGSGSVVDVLMDEDPDTPSGGSKMRSDDLLADPRAVVLTAPPGADPMEYASRGGRGRRERGGGRRGRGRRGGMDLD